MDRFPLFQLPLVAILEIMKSFHLFDLTKLSMCSQKIHRWIKRFRVIRRESLFIEVAHLDRLSVEVINDPGEEYLTFDIKSLPSTTHSVNFGGSQLIPISLENTDFQYYMHLDFDDKTEGLKTISEYLCTFFEKDITTLFLSSLPCEPIMEWVSKRQGKCRDLMIDDIKYLNYGERVIIENRPFHVFGGIDIRRNDGKTATIIHSGDQFERRTEFYMIVWDN
uniref:F-box domain-containing protein n=1 Tax=Caenorhabditis tropicalis TaxID=1561998 RepID=A0A1I7TF58_9PELO